MPLFRHKAKSEPSTVQASPPEAEPTITPAEIKLAITQLKPEKKQQAIEKEAVTTEMAQLRAAHQLQLERQGSMMRGGGSTGKWVRNMQRVSRDNDRRHHAQALAPLEKRKEEIERAMLELDREIAQLQAQLLNQEQPAPNKSR